jgi:hypothetical protein
MTDELEKAAIEAAKRVAESNPIAGKARVEFEDGLAWLYVDNKLRAIMPAQEYERLKRQDWKPTT